MTIKPSHATPGTCSCEGSPPGSNPLEEKVENLAGQYRDLARYFAEYMRDAPQDRPVRNARALAMAESLTRILGGQDVDPGTFPECCLIGDVSGGGFLRRWYCTGTLIHPRAVITAEHCISSISAGSLSPNAVAIGVDRQTELNSKSTAIISISKIIRHPTEDLALLILRRAATVPPVPRANAQQTANATRVTLVGFGSNSATGTMGFGTKREVTVDMQVVRKSNSEDLADAEATLGFNSFTEFVAGRKGSGRDSCKGDSGGPAYILIDGQRHLAGATSRATDEAMDNCGDGGIYPRVDRQQKWIDDTIRALLGG